MTRAKPSSFARLAELYDRMDQAYVAAAGAIGLSCRDCADNCCLTHFQHHTWIEWAYLWRGFVQLPKERQDAAMLRAENNVRQSRAMLARGFRPRIMCPLNEDGLCGVYEHRLMICRMHGTANLLRTPRGEQRFPGCYRFQELAAQLSEAEVPLLDRTPLYQDLAALERDFLGRRAGKLPRVDMTLAEMLVAGPPRLR